MGKKKGKEARGLGCRRILVEGCTEGSSGEGLKEEKRSFPEAALMEGWRRSRRP